MLFGFVGSKAVFALLQKGHSIRVLELPGHPLQQQFMAHWAAFGQVEIVPGDVAVYRDVEGALAGTLKTCERLHRIRKDLDVMSAIGELPGLVAGIEDAMCEQDMASQERLATIEDSLCELDAAINNK